MNHDFISNVKFLIPSFHIYLRFILCIHIYDVFSHLLMDVLQIFKKFFCFGTAYLSFIQQSQFRSIFGTTPIYNLEWWFTILIVKKLLYTDSFYGKIRSHHFGLSPTKHINKFPSLWFTTSMCPSLYRWCNELKFKFVFNSFHNLVYVICGLY